MFAGKICHQNKILYEAKCLKCPDFKYIGKSYRNLPINLWEKQERIYIGRHREKKLKLPLILSSSGNLDAFYPTIKPSLGE